MLADSNDVSYIPEQGQDFQEYLIPQRCQDVPKLIQSSCMVTLASNFGVSGDVWLGSIGLYLLSFLECSLSLPVLWVFLCSSASWNQIQWHEGPERNLQQQKRHKNIDCFGLFHALVPQSLPLHSSRHSFFSFPSCNSVTEALIFVLQIPH